MQANQVTLKGTDRSFTIHPNVKRYTLLDNGFVESSAGKFRFERQLGGVSAKQSPKLKIVISHDFSKLKMTVTNSNGLQEVNIFENDRFADEVNTLEGILYQLTEDNVLEAV